MARPRFLTPRGGLTDDVLRGALGLVFGGEHIEAIEQLPEHALTHHERLMVYDWAMREHASASDVPCHRRPRPYLVTLLLGIGKGVE